MTLDTCPECKEPIDNGKHPKLRGGRARRTLCHSTITIMVPTPDGWSLQQPADPSKALKSKVNQFPNRAARRRR